MNDKQLEYVVEVLEREISGYSKDYVPERISLLRECVRELKGERESANCDQFLEIQKCAGDINYFIEKYLLIRPYTYQKNLLTHLQTNKFSICKMPRQSGKTVCSLLVLLHELVFGEAKTIGIVAYKFESANLILERLKIYYNSLPVWMTQRITANERNIFQLENGSSVEAITYNSPSLKGNTFDTVLLDEYAFFFGRKTLHYPLTFPVDLSNIDSLELNKYFEFWDGFAPIMFSRETCRLLILSTTARKNKYHYFNKLWLEAVEGKNRLMPFVVNWKDIPGRDSMWKYSTIKTIGTEAFANEYECEIDTESP
jgi:hypothetical protein